MRAVAKSPARKRVTREPKGGRKAYGRTSVANGNALLFGVDGRSIWVKRLRETLADYESDIPDASTAERSIVRRACVLTIELERLERKFALAGEASDGDLDLYQRTAGNLRRLLEAVGLQRRAKPVPSLQEYLASLPPETSQQAVVPREAAE